MVDSNDKFLPNFITFICSVLAIAAIATIFLFINFNTIASKKNSSDAINEINIFQIPLENLVTTDSFDKSFDLDNSIYVLIQQLAVENDIDEKTIKDILTDERLNRYAYKDLYSSISNNLHNSKFFINNSNANTMAQKIIIEHELKNNITIPIKMRNQLTTIMTSYIREISNLVSIDDSDSKVNVFYSVYTILISILVLVATLLVISIVNKDKVLTIKRCSIFGLIIGLIAFTYSIIQKTVFWIFQTYFDRYSYAISSIGNVMFSTIFTCSLALILISILLLLFAKDMFWFDRDITLFVRKKKKVIKKKKTNKKKKKKTNKIKDTFKKIKKLIMKKKKKKKKAKKQIKKKVVKKKVVNVKEILIKIKDFISSLVNKIKTKKNSKKEKDLSDET